MAAEIENSPLSPRERVEQIRQSQYRGGGPRPKHTHRHANQVTVRAVYELIKEGTTFSIEDIDYILSLPATVGGGEGYYEAAVIANNASFLESMERKLERQPFFYCGVRLYLFQNMAWNGEEVRVTSLNDKNGYVVACSYYGKTQEVEHRYKLTHADLEAASCAPS